MQVDRVQLPRVLPNYPETTLSFGAVNIFIGPNNSGKTKLLELLHATLVQSLGRRQRSSPEEIVRLFATGNDSPKIQFRYGAEDRPRPELVPGLLRIGPSYFEPTNRNKFKLIPANRGFTPNFDTRTVQERRSRSAEEQNTEDLLAELAANPKLRPILVHEVGSLFGVRMSVEEIGYDLRMWAETTAGRLSFNQQGRGIQDYVALFFYLYHPDYRVVLIDEPENSLHPQLQRVLARRIREVAIREGKQVFISTHSPFFVLPASVDELAGVFVMRPHDDPPNIVQLAALIPGDAELRRRFESYLPNIDASVAELFFARAALIVEGPTERQLLKYLAIRTQREPAELDISIVESNGLALMPGLIQVAKGLGIDWRAIADGDLLNRRDSLFDEFRARLVSALGLAIPDWRNTPEATTSLSRAGVTVLPYQGIERYYRSSEAGSYGNLDHVDPADKGWLMEREIARIGTLDRAQIERDYGQLLVPLDQLREAVMRSMPSQPDVKSLIVDYLQDEGLRIHRVVQRNSLTLEQLNREPALAEQISGYLLDFRSADDYELVPRGVAGIAIVCAGQQVKIVDTDRGRAVLAEATIADA